MMADLLDEVGDEAGDLRAPRQRLEAVIVPPPDRTGRVDMNDAGVGVFHGVAMIAISCLPYLGAVPARGI